MKRPPLTSDGSEADPEVHSAAAGCSLRMRLRKMAHQRRHNKRHHRKQRHECWQIIRANPCILVVCVLMFVIMSGSVLGFWWLQNERSHDRSQRDAMSIAVDTGNWFSASLQDAIQPLYTMSNYATEIDVFAELPARIGPGTSAYNDDNNTTSLPFLQDFEGFDPDNPKTKRDVSGVCDQPDLVARFDKLSQTVLQQAGMEGVLANIQFAPYGVVCLLYPMFWNFTSTATTATATSTSDASNIITLDNTNAVGGDLLNNIRLKDFAREALKGNQIGIVGPRPLFQCPDCGDFFIVRFPVVTTDPDALPIVIDIDDDDDDDDNNSSTSSPKTYPRWGYTTVLINWDALVEQTLMRQRFQSRGMGFRLTRIDDVIDEHEDGTTTNTTTTTILAESSDLQTTNYCRHVSTEINTEHWNWTMTIYYNDGPSTLEIVLVSVLTVIVVVAITLLVFSMLTQKQALHGKTLAQQAKVDLERKMTAYFSHELRNPLSAMECALECMPLYEQSEESLELLKSMRECSTFMSSIMNNLLDARKMEEGKMILQRQAVSLPALIETVGNMVRPSLKPGVVLNYDNRMVNNDGPLAAATTLRNECCVLGDPMRLQQIITNVLNNAIKYTLAGTITISVAWAKSDVTSSSSTCSNESVCHQQQREQQQQPEQQQQQQPRRQVLIEVEDTGPGIPKDDLGHIFERFVQRGGVPGSGLGLTITKQLVELMEGSIRFESDPTIKPGTKCIILLPLEPCNISADSVVSDDDDDGDVVPKAKQQQETNKKKSSKSAGATAAIADTQPVTKEETQALIEEPISILIVDDLSMNRTLLKRRFHKCIAPNCNITEASSGEEALRIVQERGDAFDIIIQDQFLEEGGGVLVGTDVITAMRRSKIDSIIIGYSGNDIDEKFYAAGANLTWTKPMPSNQSILKSLRSLLVER